MSTIQMAMQIRNMVMIMAYPVVVFGAILMFKRGMFGGEKQMFQSIIFLAVVVACVTIYPRTVLSAADYVRFSSNEVSQQVDKGMNEWAKSKIAGEDSTFNISAKLTKVLYKASFAISGIVRAFLGLIQRVALYVLIAMSPLMLSLLLIKETSDIAVKFIMTTIAVMLWSVGFNLTDMMLFSGWDLIMHNSLHSAAAVAALEAYGIAASAISGASIATALPVVTIGLALTLCFYFLIGILVFNIIGVVLIMCLLHGGNPVSSAMSTVTATSSFANAGVNAQRAAGKLSSAGTSGIMSGASGAISGAGGISRAARGLMNLGNRGQKNS
jgi:hypothetical protein